MIEKKELRKRLNTACQLISQEIYEFKNQLNDNSQIVRDQQPEFINTYFNYDGYQCTIFGFIFLF
jgi:hypothetical protein